MGKQRKNVVPAVGAFIASSFTGISLVATKFLVKTIGPLPLGFLRYGTGGLILLAGVAGLSKRRKELLTVRRKDLPLLTWIGLVSFCLFPLAYGTSLKRLPATMGAILFATTPLWSAGLSYFIRKEKVKLLQLAGILLTLVGVGVLATAKQGDGAKSSTDLYGQGMMLLASFLMALSGVLLRPVLIRYQAITVSIYRMLLGSAGTLVIALINDGFFFNRLALLSLKQAGVMVYLAVGGGAIGYALWTYALAKLPPAQVFVFLNVSPLVAALLGVLVLGESLTLSFLIGGAIILGGVIISQVSKARGMKK